MSNIHAIFDHPFVFFNTWANYSDISELALF